MRLKEGVTFPYIFLLYDFIYEFDYNMQLQIQMCVIVWLLCIYESNGILLHVSALHKLTEIRWTIAQWESRPLY